MNRRGVWAEDGSYHLPHSLTTGGRVLKTTLRQERLINTYAYALETYRDFTSTLVTIPKFQLPYTNGQFPHFLNALIRGPLVRPHIFLIFQYLGKSACMYGVRV